MHTYKERSIPVDRVPKPVNVGYDRVPPNWNPPLALSIDIGYKRPAYRRYYERLWQDDNRPFDFVGFNKNYRSQNHPVQHYKCYLRDVGYADRDLPNAHEPVAPPIPWAVDSQTAIGVYKSSHKGADPLLPVDFPVFRSTFGAWGSHNQGLPLFFEEKADQSFLPAPPGLSTLVSNSMRAIMPKITKQRELSAINSLIELKDFASLPRTLANVYGYLKNFPQLLSNAYQLYKVGRSTDASRLKRTLRSSNLRKIRRSFNASEGRTLRELFHAPADGYLQAQFNIMPLIQDIIGIYTALSSLEKRLNALYQRVGRLQKRHNSFSWVNAQFTGPSQSVTKKLELEQFAGGTTPSGYTGCYNYLRRPVTVTRTAIVDRPAKFHAEVEFRFYLSRYQAEHTQILALLDSMGVNLDPSIIWNAIPWSFVIDWVLGVSRWLSNRRTLNLEPQISIERYLWSWSWFRRIRVSVETQNADNLSDPIPKYYLPDLYEEAYRRDVSLPSFSDPLYGGSLNSKEVSLGVALAITRRRHSNLRLRG